MGEIIPTEIVNGLKPTIFSGLWILAIAGMVFAGFQFGRLRYRNRYEDKVQAYQAKIEAERAKVIALKLQRDTARADRDRFRQNLVRFETEKLKDDFFGGSLKPIGGSTAIEVKAWPALLEPADAPYRSCIAIGDATRMVPGTDRFGDPVPPKFRVAAVAFVDRKKREGFQLGDQIISASLVPEGRMLNLWEENIGGFQVADGSSELELPLYFISGIYPVIEGSIKTSDLKVEQETQRSRLSQIKSDLTAVVATRNRMGGYAEWAEGFSGIKSELNTRIEEAGGCLTVSDGVSLVRLNPYSASTAAIEVFKYWNEVFERLGTDFIVVPIPSKTLVNAPGVLSRKGDDLELSIHPERNQFFESLLSEGVECIDLLSALQMYEDKSSQVFYEGTDEHPADGAIQIIASRIGSRLERYHFDRDFVGNLSYQVQFGIPADRKGWPPEAYDDNALKATKVFKMPGGESLDISSPHRESPVLLIGDSFIGVPRDYGCTSANIVAHLSGRLGLLPAVLERGGGAPQMMRTVAGIPEAISNRRVVVFVFSESYLTVKQDKETAQEYRWETSEISAPSD